MIIILLLFQYKSLKFIHLVEFLQKKTKIKIKKKTLRPYAKN